MEAWTLLLQRARARAGTCAASTPHKHARAASIKNLVAPTRAQTAGLSKTMVGDYLGEREDFSLKVMHAYVDALDFVALDFDEAIRHGGGWGGARSNARGRL